MAKKNRSQFAILGILALSPNISGYDIRKWMAESTDFFWKETFSSIYPVLQTLEKEGMITKQEDNSKGKRARHLYSLAPKGQKLLQDWLQETAEPHQVRSELLLKLFLGSLSAPVVSLKHIEEHQKALFAKKRVLLQVKQELLSLPKNTEGLPYWLLTIDHGLKTMDASLQWCEESVRTLKELEGGLL